MRTRSELWVDLVKGDYQLIARAEANGKTYTRITAPRISRALMGGPLSVGNCVSATLNLSLVTEDVLNASQPIVIKGCLRDLKQTRYSESLPFGTFYINKRSCRGNLLTVQCYDAMLKANQTYLSDDDPGTDWPKFMSDVVTEIAYRLGVGIDERTQIMVNDDYIVPCPTGMTMRQVLGYIGACHGGNWIITEDNLLRLVPLNTVPGMVSSTDQMSDAVTPESNINGYSFYITDEYNRPIVTKDGFYLVWANDDYVTAETGLVKAKSILGSYELGEAVTVTGVYMTDTDGNIYTAGDTSGVGVIRIESNPYACQGICEDLLVRYNGLVYAPFTANKVVYDPAAELGDQITIHDKVSSVIYSANMTLDLLFTANISAPSSEELSAEYPFLTEIQRLAQANSSLRATIEKTADDLEKLTENSGTDLAGLAAALTAEIERASGVEANLADRLAAEETRATQAEEWLQAYVNEENARALTAEEALGGRIDAQATLIADLTAKLAALTERVSALEGGTDPGDGTDPEGGTDPEEGTEPGVE